MSGAWWTLLAAFVVTFGLRWAVVLVAVRRPLPAVVERLSPLVAPALAGTLLAVALVSTHGVVLLRDLVVVAAGLTIARLTRSVPLTVAGGLAVLATWELWW